MTRYIMRHIFHLTMFALLGVGLLVGSTPTDSQPNKSVITQPNPPLPKCGTVDASSSTTPPACYVKKGRDEIVWENLTKPNGVYMCVNSKKDPFEAYAWYIPYNEKRHTGKVRQDLTPDPHGYDFYSSDDPCTDPPTKTGETIRNTPHVIIQ
jgi:hypothetical protein